MGAPIVTIGGKVVYTAPEATRLRPHNTPSSPAPNALRNTACRRDRRALAVGLAVLAGLLTLLFLWVVAHRERMG